MEMIRFLDARMFPWLTDGKFTFPMAGQGLLPEVPAFIVEKELHLRPNKHAQPLSWSAMRQVDMASLGIPRVNYG